MANFKTHFSAGLLLGVAATLAAMTSGMTEGLFQSFFLVLVPLSVGSTLPDIDSDSSVPFTVAFGSLSLVAALVVGAIASEFYGDVLPIVGWALFGGGFFWLVVGGGFKKITKHRGMAHSVPAAVLVMLTAFGAAQVLGLSSRQSLAFGASFGAGYLLHLVLDELYSTIDFEGRRLAVKKSLGSALKFFSHRHRITAVVYLLVVMAMLSVGESFLTAAFSVAAMIRRS